MNLSKIPKKYIIASNFILFGQYYFPDIFYHKSPDFHYIIGDAMKRTLAKEGKKIAFSAPRGFSKTTLITILGGIYTALVYGHKKKVIVVISQTDDMAKKFIESIKSEILTNERLKRDWGKNGVLKNPKGVWSSHEIDLTNGVRIIAKGAGSQIRGTMVKSKRPDLILCDDLLGSADMKSDNIRESRLDWFMREVLPAGKDSGEASNLIVLNTRLHPKDLIGMLSGLPTFEIIEFGAVEKFSKSSLWLEWKEIFVDMKNPKREEMAKTFFEKNKEVMLKGSKVLWSQMNDYYTLMVKKTVIGDSAFSTEYQNEPTSDKTKLFHKDKFFYDTSLTQSLEEIVIAHDPAIQRSDTSDFAPILVLGRDKSGYIYVLDVFAQRKTPHQMLAILIRMIKDYRPDYCYIETNAFQQFYFAELGKLLVAEGIYETILRGITNTGNKNLRISSLEPMLVNGYIRFLEYKMGEPAYQMLVTQLDEFNPKVRDNTDDLPDCLELGVRKWRKYYIDDVIANYRK